MRWTLPLLCHRGSCCVFHRRRGGLERPRIQISTAGITGAVEIERRKVPKAQYGKNERRLRFCTSLSGNRDANRATRPPRRR